MNTRQPHDHLGLDWHMLCRLFTPDYPLAQRILGELTECYEADGRYYHTLAHVMDVLQHVRSAYPGPAGPPPTLLFAVWFHDIIYEPESSDNETRSAEFAAAKLQQIGVAGDKIARIKELILVTVSHQPPPEDRSASILVDADLAILGAAPATYDQYAKDIRKEYSFVPAAAYEHGRQRILQHFLERSPIYHTEFFAGREPRARRNLQRELAQYMV